MHLALQEVVTAGLIIIGHSSLAGQFYQQACFMPLWHIAKPDPLSAFLLGMIFLVLFNKLIVL